MNTHKIVVISDTHGNAAAIEALLPIINEANYLIHLGDGSADLMHIIPRIKAHVVCVAGNCDFGSHCPQETVLTVGQTRFFLTHGHSYGVKSSLYRLSLKAASEGCHYALFGHTHVPIETFERGITMINPGSLRISSLGKPTFAVISGNGESFFSKIMVL